MLCPIEVVRDPCHLNVGLLGNATSLSEIDVEKALQRGVAWCDLASLQAVARKGYNKSSWARALRARGL